MDQKLTKIKIQGLKSIKELELELGDINILIGANGAGKSNFIYFFRLLNNIVKGNLQQFIKTYGGADNFLFYGSKSTQEIKFDLRFADNYYHLNLQPSEDNSFIISEEETHFFGSHYRNEPYLYSNLRESQVIKQTNTVCEFVTNSLKSWSLYHFHDTSNTAKVKKSCLINDNISLAADAGNLSAFLLYLKNDEKKNYELIRNTIQLIAPFFEDFILRPISKDSDQIQLEWKEKGNDTPFLAHHFSDGTLRFICLTTLLLQPNLPSAIIIDEPELGLHPYAISVLASLIKSASTKTQLILATQSSRFIDEFKPKDIIVVDRKSSIVPYIGEQNESTFRRLEPKELESWLEDYSLGELWEKNIFGGRP